MNDGKHFVNVKERPIFESYIMPLGWLTRDMACHALWRYYLSARFFWEKDQENLLAFEGNVDTGINYTQLFSSIARWYDVTPEEMARHWPAVDMQCTALDLPKMPEGDRYRFNKVPEIKTDGGNRKERRASNKANRKRLPGKGSAAKPT